MRAGVIGNLNGIELLHLLPIYLGAKTVVELGSGSGYTASVIGGALKHTGGMLHSVDVDECVGARKRVEEYGLDNVVFHRVDAVEFCRAWKGTVDMVFEDCAHTYIATSEVLKSMAPRVRVGGLMLVHDVKNVDVERAVVDFCKDKEWIYAIDHAGAKMALLCRAPRSERT